MTTTPVTVPAGFVLVPEEPTPEMIEAFSVECERTGSTNADCFRAMMAARPAITAGTDAGALEWETCKPLSGDCAELAHTSFGEFRIERRADQFELTGPGLDMRWSEGLDIGKAAFEWYFTGISKGYAQLLYLAALTPETAEAVPVAAQPGEAVQETLMDLLPCPFCGGSPTLHEHSTDHSLGAWVSCSPCGLEGPTETGQSVGETVRHWNTRAALASVPAPDGDDARERIARALNSVLGSEEDEHPRHHPAQNSWEEPSEVWWTQWLEAADAVLATLSQPKEPRT